MSDLFDRVSDVFGKAPFIVELGIRLVAAGEGWVETEMALEERFRQQHGFAHAGVVSTIADHTAGAAASTLISPEQSVLTADYTVHLLRPAGGDILRSRGEVAKSGRSLIVAHSDVWAGDVHCARYVSTLAVVDRAI